jgi:hypothetical protein
MKHRFFAWVVILSAAAAVFGTAPADALAKTGRVEGRMTVDGKPVTEFQISLSAKKPKAKAKITTTDSDGRFVFKSVAPGRNYELATALAVKPPAGGQRPSCKVSGANMGFSAGQPAGFTITALVSDKFSVKAGQTVTRNIQSDCEPDADIVTPTTIGRGAK